MKFLIFGLIFYSNLCISYRTSQPILIIFIPPSPLQTPTAAYWNSYTIITCVKAYCVKLMSPDITQCKFIHWGIVRLSRIPHYKKISSSSLNSNQLPIFLQLTLGLLPISPVHFWDFTCIVCMDLVHADTIAVDSYEQDPRRL